MRQPIVVLLFLLSSCGSPAAFNQDTTTAGTLASVNAGAAAGGSSPGDATAASSVAMALTSIAISPEKPTLALGTNQQFTATGTLNDGSKKDVTALVSWSLGDGGALEQVDAETKPGLIKAAAEGNGTLTATNGLIKASTAVSVTAASIVSIAVQTSPALTAGAPASVKAIATYSDGHTADVTSQVDWSVNGAPAGGASGNANGSGSGSSGTNTAGNGSGTGGAGAGAGSNPGATFTNTPGGGTTVTVAASGPTTITATIGGTSGDTKVTVNGGLVCATRETIVKSASNTTLSWTGVAGDTVYTIVPTTMAPPVDIGTVTSVTTTDGTHKAVYHAPSAVVTSFDVKIVATPKNTADTAGTCSIRLSADGAIGVVDNGTTQGPVGNVYQIPAGQQSNSAMLTAAWFTQTPIANIVMANFDVPNTPYQLGFPGFPNLTAWFTVRFDGQINIPTPGAYTFQLNADDGAILYIDGLPVVNDDGVHSIKLATGAPVQLTAGMHTFRLDYFEGPPVYLALQMMWKGPNDSGFSIVPANYFSRPKTP